MEENCGYVWLIIVMITIVTIFKIINQIYHKRTDESSIVHQQMTEELPSINSQISSELEKFGPVNYYANARHDQEDRWFQFMYCKVNGEWLAYILRMPSLNGRSGDLHLTHRYKKDNTYWICYDPQPRTLDEVQSVSRAWSDRELEYITTGITFEEQKW